MRPRSTAAQLGQFRPTEVAQQGVDELHLLTTENDLAAVGSVIDLIEGRSSRRPFISYDGLAILRENGSEDVGQGGDGDVVHADVDVIPLPCPLPPQQRHQHPRESLQRRQQVRHRDAGDGWRAVPSESHSEQAADRLHRQVVGRPIAVGAILAERADRTIDDARVARAHLRIADAQSLDHARPERLHDDVRGFAKRQQRLAALRLLQVEDHALLSAIEAPEEHGVGPVGETDGSPRIASPRLLDLNHFGPVIGHCQGKVGPRQKY